MEKQQAMQDALPAKGTRMCQQGPAAGKRPMLVRQDATGRIPGKDAQPSVFSSDLQSQNLANEQG
jgi:hypothetical protein